MAKKQRAWQEKLLDSKGHPTIGPVNEKMSRRWGEGIMVIPAPMEIDEVPKSIGNGHCITIDQIRDRLAREHGVDFACPMTAGIFTWIAAHATDEAEQNGAKEIIRYRRTLKTGGELNPKYLLGIENIRPRLEAAGHAVVPRGKRYFVQSVISPST